MFWKYNSMSSSQIDTLLDRIAAHKATTAEAAAASGETGAENEVSQAEEAKPESEESEQKSEVTQEDVKPEDSARESPSVTASPTKSVPTLKDILDQEDVIQECKNQNRKLVEYLCQPEILSELISLITMEPSPDIEENFRFRLPHVAAEILTCEVAQINEAISSDEALLTKLYSFMEINEPPLNPLLASFFSKAFGVLITRKSEQNWYSYQYNCIQVFEFLKKKDLVNDVLRHIGTSAISDLILRLITCVEGTDVKQNLLEWLNDKKLIQSIISLLDISNSRNTHDNASRLLIEILRVSRDGQYAPPSERCEDPILATLEEPDTIQQLLDVIFKKPENDNENFKSESSLVNGMLVLLTLLESRKPQAIAMPASLYSASTFNSGPDPDSVSPEEIEKQQKILDATIRAILPRIRDFTDLLVNPPVKSSIKTTAGLLDPPLGATRLNFAKLVNTLLSTNDMSVNQSLAENKTLDILLDLFFKYSLNNFLHLQVEQCISHVFDLKIPSAKNASSTPPTVPTSPKSDANEEGMETAAAEEKPNEPNEDMVVESKSDSNPLLEHLMTNCNLIERILDAWDDNDNNVSKQGYQRKGYMGHLTKIANIIAGTDESETRKVALSSELNKLSDDTKERWETFVNGKLKDINAKNVIIAASSYANAMSNSEDDDADFKDLTFPQESALQQMQQMSGHFIDSFGFGTEDIGDDDSASSARRFNAINFGLDEDDFDKNETRDALFETVCNAKNREDEDDDIWSDKTKEIDFGIKDPEDEDKNSSDGDIDNNEEEAKKKKMEVEDDEDWAKFNSSQPTSSVIAMDTGNPWDNSKESSKEQQQQQQINDFNDDSSDSTSLPDTAKEVRSSTPPDGGWANFGELNDDSKEGMETAPIVTTSTTENTSLGTK